MKRYAVSDEQKDPIIDDGQAYFVPNGPYLEMVKKYKGQAPVCHLFTNTCDHGSYCLQMSTCTGLAALDHADTKFSNGYAATGVGACIDGRHEFMLANGVGDLQKGERYVQSIALRILMLIVLLGSSIWTSLTCTHDNMRAGSGSLRCTI